MPADPALKAPAAPGAMLPYGRHSVAPEDVRAVVEVLESDWLTTGPWVRRFEDALAARVGARQAVSFSSGTAALHGVMHALGIGPGDEVIVPPMTFAATANCVLYVGATPVFADVDPDTLLLDPAAVEAAVGPRTRAIIAVDYAGQPCDYAALGDLARRHGLALVADACHSLGASYRGRPVGALADATVFSLHPVKPITAGEGGAVTTDDADLAARLERFRNHGIDRDFRSRDDSWEYDLVELGYNYRLTDIQCALAASQLERLDTATARRTAIATAYDTAFAGLDGVAPLRRGDDRTHAWHLYVVRVAGDRAGVFHALRGDGIGVNVHYRPVHLHSCYRERLGTGPGLCPTAEAAYERILTLPVFPAMTDGDVDRVVSAMRRAVGGDR